MPFKLQHFLIRVAVFTAAAATMTLELLQVRILSFLNSHGLVYVTIPIVMTGLGTAGVFVSLRSRRNLLTGRFATVMLAAFAVSTVICFRLVSFAPPNLESFGPMVGVLGTFILLMIPFFFSGAAIAAILFLRTREIQELYFWDLIASAIGVMAFVFFLRPLGADLLLWIVTISILVSTIACGFAFGVDWRILIPAFTIVGGCFSLWGHRLLGEIPDSTKIPGMIFRDEKIAPEYLHTVWTPLSRIDLIRDPAYRRTWRRSDGIVLTQDGSAFTPWMNRETVDYLNEEQSKKTHVSYRGLLYFLKNPCPEMLIIGVGGGMDIFSALAWDVTRITGVEINPATLDMFKANLSRLATPEQVTRVSLHLGDGRHFIKATERLFDVIQVPAVDTFAAPNVGNIFAENYLFTVEAMEDYLRHLRDDGILMMSRPMGIPARDATRLLRIYVEAARRLQVPEPEKSFFAVFKPLKYRGLSGVVGSAAFFFKKRAFTPEEIDPALEQMRRIKKPPTALYIPSIYAQNVQKQIDGEFLVLKPKLDPVRQMLFNVMTSRSPQELEKIENDALFNMSPTYDDRPFFFHGRRLDLAFANFFVKSRQALNEAHLIVAMCLITLFASVCMMAPLIIFGRERAKTERVGSWCAIFSCLGAGFMFAELGLIQKLTLYLGSPIYSLATVLGGLLLATGIGSLLTKIGNRSYWQLLRLGLFGSFLTLLVWFPFAELFIENTLSWPLSVRVVFALFSIFPIGLSLGVPFVCALKLVELVNPSFVPWAWGINGLTGVLGSSLAILLAPRIGISALIFVSAGIYFITLLIVVSARPAENS